VAGGFFIFIVPGFSNALSLLLIRSVDETFRCSEANIGTDLSSCFRREIILTKRFAQNKDIKQRKDSIIAFPEHPYSFRVNQKPVIQMNAAYVCY
jgi:hypothetical protein